MKSKTSKRSTTRRGSRPSQRAVVTTGYDLQRVISQQQIQKRVHQLAKQIDHDYQGRTLHVVGILEDCFILMADLVRSITIPVFCHFLKAEMHDNSAGPVAMREIVYTPKLEARGRDVLLVNGILQTGLTLDYLYGSILGQNASSVRTLSFIEKTGARRVDLSTGYVGFTSKEGFLVGYGLGYEEKYRNLPFVARLSEAM